MIVDESREVCCRVMAKLVEQGAQAIILGCAEITLLVGQADASVPVFGTTAIHAEEAVNFLLEGGEQESGA